MARSFASVKIVSAFITRRGYAASSQGGVSSSVRSGAPNVVLKKGSEESAKEIDAAELREMLVKNKIRRQ